MNSEGTWRPSKTILALSILLLATVIFVLGTMFVGNSNDMAAGTAIGPDGRSTAAPWNKADTPAVRATPPSLVLPSAGQRQFDTYYERRAYPGAPPFIPHDLTEASDQMALGAAQCNACHGAGGYVAQLDAYAPVTPHPDYLHCRQCHVAQVADAPQPLARSTWQRPAPPPLGQSAMPGGPPRIPHTLQLRENCVACHGGPAALAPVATDHPERANCRQCHVPAMATTTWSRP